MNEINETKVEEQPDDQIAFEEDQPSIPKEEKKEESTNKITTNAILISEITLPESEKDNDYSISLPSYGIEEFNELVLKNDNAEIDEKDPKYANIKRVIENATDLYTPGGLYSERFKDPKSSFTQGVKISDDVYKGMSSLKFKAHEGELKGEVAILKVSKALGLGDVLCIPLPHSGIWVRIKPPTERDLIDFYNNIFREKIMLGRLTQGLTLTNFSAHINNKLIDFIIPHILSINYSDISKDELKNYILIHDLPILAWGMAATRYPNGFHYSRACINDLEKCTHVEEGMINMLKLLWVDNTSLTITQRNILEEDRSKNFTKDTYQKYILDHSRVRPSELQLTPDIKIKFKVPTLAEFTSCGLSWVNKINSSIDALIVDGSAEDENKAKMNLLNQYVKASVLRQYSHFIEHIVVNDSLITDRDTIDGVLETFSSDDVIRNKILEAAFKYQSDTTISLIGIPNYKCPKCQVDQNPNMTNASLVSVIPLDTMQLFFTLLTLLISKVADRDI